MLESFYSYTKMTPKLSFFFVTPFVSTLFFRNRYVILSPKFQSIDHQIYPSNQGGSQEHISLLLQLQPFYGSLDFVRDYPGKPVPER